MTLGEQVAEAVREHASVTRAEARARVLELFRAVRIPAPELRMRQYPHQVSGGQRQRVVIAMAFAGNPSLLIADEPTTALDVTVQAQVLALMAEFRERTQAAVVLITHDLAVIAEMCERVLVMYAGQIVEEGAAVDVLKDPRHPYTQGLLASLPALEGERATRLPSIPGRPPDLAALPAGCPFAERCPRVMAICREQEPVRTTADSGHGACCHLLNG
jgi:oligopeptide transport system ATP-binding protein